MNKPLLSWDQYQETKMAERVGEAVKQGLQDDTRAEATEMKRNHVLRHHEEKEKL